ncbi:MAG: F0F1 ATP synthase subunit gamma [Vicinamibacterales bacterium]
MKRAQTLRRQLAALRLLGEAIDAMRSLSAHHLRRARAGLAPARAYRAGIDRALASTGIMQALPAAHLPATVVLGPDLGLCGGYTEALVAHVAARRRTAAGPVYCVGRRPEPSLRRAGVEVARRYDGVSSLDGTARLLLTLADDVVADYAGGRFATLDVVSARFDGVGAFTTVTTSVLPVAPHDGGAPAAATPYVRPEVLARTAVREYLYSTLHGLLVDALAAEHGMRLVATQAAGEWLDGEIERLQRQVSRARQAAGTQEVLDVAAAARLRRRAS